MVSRTGCCASSLVAPPVWVQAGRSVRGTRNENLRTFATPPHRGCSRATALALASVSPVGVQRSRLRVLDDTNASSHNRGFPGLKLHLRALSGAKAVRVIYGASQAVPAHQHDWVCLTIPLVGSGIEHHEEGTAEICGPSVLLHPPGRFHGDQIGEDGFEAVAVRFDLGWLRHFSVEVPVEASRAWIGGSTSINARRLAAAWANPKIAESCLAELTGRFLHASLSVEDVKVPRWFKFAARYLRSSASPSTADLAKRLDLHPAWLARRYRLAAGEGIEDTVRRNKVERAVKMLRSTELPLSQVAADSGFCDQSHMNRCFSRLLGRSPAQVRSERLI
jgi:AraC family transcriptional regulator